LARVTPTFPHADGDVSVVIVAYLCEQELEECLASFERHQPRRVGEVIVVDNTLPLPIPPPSQQFPWIRYDPVGANLHFRKGVNRGADKASLRYLFLLNPDTMLVDADSIAKLADILDRDEAVGFAGPKIAGDDGTFGPQGERLAGLAYLFALKSYLNALWPQNPITRRQLRATVSREVSGRVDTLGAAVLLCRRPEFLSVGGFDEDVAAYWEEQELARKYQRLDLHGYYVAEALVRHRWRRGGTQHELEALSKRHFDEAMAHYYRHYGGHGARALFAILDYWQRLVRALR
jgi:N-acetylglucosaminyl-diphospho-decaprenol L-rhamnosyltransferase